MDTLSTSSTPMFSVFMYGVLFSNVMLASRISAFINKFLKEAFADAPDSEQVSVNALHWISINIDPFHLANVRRKRILDQPRIQCPNKSESRSQKDL